MAAFPIFSLPEQLALSLGKDIVGGRYAGGERLIETEVARLFSVSRGPVRDAFLLLERRRFITIEPRRGAFVRPISLNSIADVFNVRTSLLATAARFMAGIRTELLLSQLDQNVRTVQALAVHASTTPACFLNAVNQMERAIVLGSGNELIAELLRDLDQQTVWPSLWVSPPHFQSLDGREHTARLITAIVKAVHLGDAFVAESTMRRMTEYCRDEIIGALACARNEEVAPSRML
jgi:DNA-binding GntR family transcriptional regulator